jgi:hypothetical protein
MLGENWQAMKGKNATPIALLGLNRSSRSIASLRSKRLNF